jgi:hypothetical protein
VPDQPDNSEYEQRLHARYLRLLQRAIHHA